MDEDTRFIRFVVGIGASVVGVLAFIVFAFSTYFTIDQGERGVILHYGKVVGEAEPGLHFKLPFVTSVAKISVQVQRVGFDKQGDADARMQAYSRDQQPATVAMSVNFHVTDPTVVYSEYGGSDGLERRIIWPRCYEQLKNVFGQFDAADAIQKRAALNAEVYSAIRNAVRGPVVIDSVQIEDITFSSQYEQAVEQRMQAIVKQQQAEADKAKRMIDADAAKYEKEAQADALLYTAQAEAKGIQAKGEALKDNPQIVSLTAAQKWDGTLPATMVPGAGVPFINLK